MKWHRPQAAFVYPNPSLDIAGGGMRSPLFSDDGQFVCADGLLGSRGWSIVQNPLPHFRIDGEDFEPLRECYYGGAPCWEGGSSEFRFLHFSVAHDAWIIQIGTPTSNGIPTAFRDWATGEWKGGAWFEAANLSFDPDRETIFEPRGTLLNGDPPPARTARLFLPRWEWESDGRSTAPFGRYVGKEGCEGTKYVGAAAYRETGTGNVWIRAEEGDEPFLKREDGAERSSAWKTFPGAGTGFGIMRDGLLYFTEALPSGESGATFSPWAWDADAKKYVRSEETGPFGLVYGGRTMAKRLVYGHFTEVALWR